MLVSIPSSDVEEGWERGRYRQSAPNLKMAHEELSDEELRVLSQRYRTEANALLKKSYDCDSIIYRRSASVAMHEAQRAMDRAKNGVCTGGVGDCPVHQMGSCKNA